MNRRLRGLATIGLALFFGVVAAGLAVIAVQQARPEEAPPVLTVSVVVPVETIPERTLVTADMLQERTMPAEARHPDAVESINVVAGRVTKVPLIAGEQVLASKLALEREDAGLALIIPAGNRAISVEVSEVSGTGGLILPGDRVDVIGVCTTRIDSTEEEPVGTSSDVITDTNVIVRAVTPLQNVTVMAVAQALRSETRSADDEESDGSQRRDIAESATLSVRPSAGPTAGALLGALHAAAGAAAGRRRGDRGDRLRRAVLRHRRARAGGILRETGMARNTQVLLVEEDGKERAALRRRLALADLAVVGESAFGQEAFNLARSLSPDLVVISMEDPVIRALRTMEQFAQSLPDLPILTVSTLGDSESLRKAMVSGSREYVIKPATAEKLREAAESAVRSAEKRARTHQSDEAGSVRTGTLITVFAAKGGVGKTTITTNLAVNLARRIHQRVAVVDLDHQFGAAPVMMNLKPLLGLEDFVAGIDSLSDETINELMVEHPSGAFLLSLPAELGGLAQLDGEQVRQLLELLGLEDFVAGIDSLSDETINELMVEHPSGAFLLSLPAELGGLAQLDGEQVRQLLELLGRHFDYVLVDTPPAINDGVTAAMEMSTMVLLVTSVEVSCVRNTGAILDFMRDWEYFDERIKIVVNRPNASNSLKESDLQEFLDRPVLAKVPFDQNVAAAGQRGQQLVLERAMSPAAKTLNDLLIAITGIKPDEETGRFRRLLGRG